MFQYVRQAENRWLGKTYILRLNDGNDAYAMDISDLTPEQSADLEERYYNQLTIDHESVVKSNGILELDASQKAQFPTNIGNVFFVELIHNSIKQKKRQRRNQSKSKCPARPSVRPSSVSVTLQMGGGSMGGSGLVTEVTRST